MTTPNEQAPSTRSEWLALIREAVRLELEAARLFDPASPSRDALRFRPPQPPSEG